MKAETLPSLWLWYVNKVESNSRPCSFHGAGERISDGYAKWKGHNLMVTLKGTVGKISRDRKGKTRRLTLQPICRAISDPVPKRCVPYSHHIVSRGHLGDCS